MEKQNSVDVDDGSVSGRRKTHHHGQQLSLSFYYRMGDQLTHQADLYRKQGNVTDLYTTLSTYCRLISELPRHPSYSTYSGKEKLQNNKIYHEFIKELESLKPQRDWNPQTQEDHALLSHNETKGVMVPLKLAFFLHAICLATTVMDRVYFSQVKCCGVAETRSRSLSKFQSPCSTGFITGVDWDANVHRVTQSSPSPVLSCIHSMPQTAHVAHVTRFNATSDSRNGYPGSSYQDVHISERLMEDFLELAIDNTVKDLETCGVLGASLRDGIFYVTTLIIPKQETTSSSCQALNEEEIYAIQSEQSLFPVGWIHTHPSQTCFMSSIDLHTQYSYQVMLPEAVAIVMAPTDTTRSCGIFRLCDPGGTNVLRECRERGFHPHQEPSDGSPIYEDCSNVYVNPNLRFEIFDLR